MVIGNDFVGSKVPQDIRSEAVKRLLETLVKTIEFGTVFKVLALCDRKQKTVVI